MEVIITLALLPFALAGLALLVAPFNAIIEQAEEEIKRNKERKHAAELAIARDAERARIRQQASEKAAKKAAFIAGQRLTGDWLNKPL